MLPDRFDEEGRRKPERGDDILADKLENAFSGKGGLGRFFSKFSRVGKAS